MLSGRRNAGGSLGSSGIVTRNGGDLPAGSEIGPGRLRRNYEAVFYQTTTTTGLRQAALAPWQNPSASLAQTVAQQHASELPEFIQASAHLCYLSQTSGRKLEVIVEKISRLRKEIKIIFVEDPRVWKAIPFTMVFSRANPLLGPWVEGRSGERRMSEMLRMAQRSEPDKSLLLSRLQGPATVSVETVVVDGDDNDDVVEVVKRASRSRSPRRRSL